MNTDFQKDVERLSNAPAIGNILDVVCRITGMGFAAVARVTEDRWIACSVKDDISFGLLPGGELKIETTICNEIRQHGQTVIINEVACSPEWSGHHTPQQYGFQSYISAPIMLSDGRFFGTLCAIDPEPRKIDTPEVRKMFELFAQLIAYHLDTSDELSATRSELLERNETALLRDQFIAVLGHDLRNPLSAVDAGARMLERDPLTDRQRGVLRMILASTLRMTGLVNNVLDFARGRLGGGITLDRQAVDIEPVLTHVIQEVRAGAPDHLIEADLRCELPVQCDSNRVAQLLSNLLGNAVAHGSGDAPIRVTARALPAVFELSVSNVAPHIPESIRERLFLPFFRAADGPQSGLGLGLFISSEIARAHGGELSVTSDANQVRFTLTLPQG